MKDAVQRRETCRLCNAKNLELVVRLVPTPVGDAFVPKDQLDVPQPAYPLDLLLCRQCGNVQLLNVVDPDIIYRQYYYKSSVSLGLVDHFRRYAESLRDQIKPTAGSLVVEIGSNEGALLRPFKEWGYRVLGIDPAIEIARTATESGIETMPTYFTVDLAREIKSKNGMASLIVANNVFANIDDLSNVIEGVKTLLAPDGVFVIETSYWLDVVEKLLIDTIFHEHLTYFSVKPLSIFFERNGMQLIDVVHGPTKGGSIRCMVQLKGGKRAVSPAVTHQIESEEKAGIFTPERYKLYTDQINSAKEKLLANLRKLKSQGKTIAGYGAAVGLTTVIYHFGLGEVLSFLVDDNTDKHNTFSPGLHLPTLPSSALYDRKPDAVVVLAWRYADAIIDKHQQYLSQGGKFIPLFEK